MIVPTVPLPATSTHQVSVLLFVIISSLYSLPLKLNLIEVAFVLNEEGRIKIL